MAIKYDISKIIEVPIDQVKRNTWNPKNRETKEFAKIKEGIRLKGQRLPVIVRENDGYEIIDGEQRFTACEQLGFDKILIYNEGKISDREAKELTIWYQQQVPFNEIELASLIADITSEDYFELPFDETEIENYKDLLDFDWEELEKESVDKDDDNKSVITIKCTSIEQYEVIMQAIMKVRAIDDCSDEQAIERICADFLGK